MSDSVRIGVLGVGSIGYRHLRAVQTLGGVPIAITRRPDRLAALCADGIESHPSLASCATSLDALAIASPTGEHLADLESAADAGIRFILVEKPLVPALDPSIESRLRAVASRASVWIGYCLRFEPAMDAFRRVLPEAGALHAVRAECRSYLPDWRPGRSVPDSYAADPKQGGVLRDLSHEVDYLTWILGLPGQVMAKLDHTGRLGLESDDQCELMWESRGVSVTVGLDYLTRVPLRYVAAHGSEGTVRWDLLQRTVEVATPSGCRAVPVDGAARDIYQLQMKAFMESLGTESAVGSLATLAEAMDVVRVCDAARLASDRKAAVTIEYPVGSGVSA